MFRTPRGRQYRFALLAPSRRTGRLAFSRRLRREITPANGNHREPADLYSAAMRYHGRSVG